jgi:hypothetical protein
METQSCLIIIFLSTNTEFMQVTCKYHERQQVSVNRVSKLIVG